MHAKMTIKQKKFADEYIISGNATEAAILAGYSDKYAGTNSGKLLNNTNVKAYIDERMQELEDKAIAKQDEVLKYLTALVRGAEKEEVLKGVGMGEQVVSKIEVSAKDRIKAAELLGKRYGMWTDRLETDGGVNIVISGSDELED